MVKTTTQCTHLQSQRDELTKKIMPSVSTKLEVKVHSFSVPLHQPPVSTIATIIVAIISSLVVSSHASSIWLLRKIGETNRNRIMQKSPKGKLLACHPAPKLPRSKSECPPIHPEQVRRNELMKLDSAANSCNRTSPPSYPASRSRFIIVANSCMEIVSTCTSSYDNSQPYSRTLPLCWAPGPGCV